MSEFENTDMRVSEDLQLIIEKIDHSCSLASPWSGDVVLKKEQLKLGEMITALNNNAQRIANSSLSISLDEWISSFQKRHSSMGILVTYQTLGEPEVIPLAIQHEITTILQEACNNAVKHSEASMIQVLTLYEKSRVRLTVADNGIGIDLAELKESSQKGQGFMNLRKRIDSLGGKLDVQSKENESGAVIIITIPISTESDKCNFNHSIMLGNKLHDVLCPEIIGVSMMIKCYRSDLTEDDAEKWYALKCVEDTLCEAAAMARNLSHHLLEN